MAMMAVEALKNAGRDLNEETMVEGYEKIRGFDTQGVCGIVDYGPNDHKAIDYHRIFKADAKTKQLVPVTGWRKPVEQHTVFNDLYAVPVWDSQGLTGL